MFTIRLVDTDYVIDNRFGYIKRLCRDYMTQSESAVSIKVSDEELAYEKSLADGLTEGACEAYAVFRKISKLLIPKGIIPFHASALAMDGKAYIFTAPSGTGKSTHARLWRERFGSRAVTINDDKPMLSFGEAGIRAWGTPWCGKEMLQTPISAEVAGILVLRQAECNTIRRLSHKEAFPLLLHQGWFPEDNEMKIKVISLISELSALPVFELGCTISQEAVTLAYEALADVACRTTVDKRNCHITTL